jgi:hypothetical protein
MIAFTMLEESQEEAGFRHSAEFVPGEMSGALGLGPLETQYEELFAEALSDGIITEQERQRLEKAADNLGLDRARLTRLEQAMVAAYQAHHQVAVVDEGEAYASLSPLRVDAAGDPGRALLLKRIEELEGRVRELEAELSKARTAVNVEVDLAEVESAAELATEDPEAIWRRVRRDPTHAEGLHQLYGVHRARGDLDAAFCVAEALSFLGVADADQRELFEAHRTQTLIAPRAGLSPNAWYDLLIHPEQELLTSQIFAVIAPAALIGRVTALRRDGQLYVPPPGSRQDLATTTLTAVRAVGWGAAILGVPVPGVYVDRDRDAAYEHVAQVPPLTVLGRRALSGPDQLEHAFHVGRHLAFYRGEHFIKTMFSAVTHLEDLFLAALAIASPALSITDNVKQRVRPIAEAIQPLLEPVQLDSLRGLFLRFAEEGGRTNLLRYSAAVDKTACRAGLLLAADLHAAARVLEKEEGRHGELVKDLIIFSTSTRYTRLRRQLGVALDAA